MSSKKLRDRLCQHYQSIGIDSTNANRFSNLVSTWIERSGPEWACDRLKAIHVTFRDHLINPGTPYSPAGGWETRKNRRGQTIYKDGLVHRMMQQLDQPSRLVQAQAFFRTYQIMRLSDISEAQLSKFKSSVETPAAETEEYRESLAELILWLKGTDLRIPRASGSEADHLLPLVKLPPSEKRAPVFKDVEWSNDLTTLVRTDPESKSINLFEVDKDWNRLWEAYPDDVSRCIAGKSTYVPRSTLDVPYDDACVGRIGFIQEGGCKLRAVANPFLIVQAVGEPLKLKLEALYQRIPEIYTGDQGAGKQLIASWLESGSTVHCFDASAFTDRFPYAFQREVLLLLKEKGYASDFDIDVFDTVVSKSWELPRQLGAVRYEVGQPMGFGPSFHLATIAHYCLVRTLQFMTGDNHQESEFAIVGDDIVIRNAKIASLYHKYAQAIGIEINMTKSVISDIYGEFCGKIITELGESPSTKVKEVTHVDQLVRLIEFYGPRGLKYLQGREQQWALKTLLPIDLGGLGMSPDGMSYKEYLDVLDTQSMRINYVRSELEGFYRASSRQQVEDTLEWYASCWDTMFPYADVLRVASAKHKVAYSWYTGFPVQHEESPDDNGDPVRSRRPAYADIFDSAMRIHLRDAAKRADLGDKEKILSLISGCVLNEEKSPKGDIPTITKIRSNIDGKANYKHRQRFISKEYSEYRDLQRKKPEDET